MATEKDKFWYSLYETNAWRELPYGPYTSSQLRQISDYMFDHQIQPGASISREQQIEALGEQAVRYARHSAGW